MNSNSANTQTTSDVTTDKSAIELTVDSPVESTATSSSDMSKSGKSNNFEKFKRSQMFLDLMIKSTIIVIIFCLQPIVIDVFWYFERYAYISILIPMNIMSVNTIIDAFCILLFYKFGDGFYHCLCKCNQFRYNGTKCGCHYCCQSCCKSIVTKSC